MNNTIVITLLSLQTMIVLMVLSYRLRRNLALLFYEPINLAIGAYLIIACSVPLLQEFTVYYRYQSQYSTYTHLIVIVINSLSLAVCYISYRYFKKRLKGSFDIKIEQNKYFYGFLILMLPIALYAVVERVIYIQSITQIEYLRDRIGYSAGQTKWTLLSNLVYVICLCVYCEYLSRKKMQIPAMYLPSLAIGLCCVVVYLSVLTSSRNSLMILVLCLVLVA